ncbi:hypothetical protein ASPZODRAFT_144443 [Penicilliopsis zonata CBS 506.65]|uniref:Xylanolytic transcriptional activator xlnR n=1 Tax=Penicilliopsis zonata CBS 506.65 TaxID=1073090 RepID=A0A1L9SDH7_9EURO|nr:hypothetical protein ASPZODRAFT_144443 [Penicilliopsis zonata CBS 506.65]OJJ45144.1 hypothetical protein ASPZODRAFT_144443 [Penicilliopsis zonata CBS 506.65]
MALRLRKACDYCHQSKVKCSGRSPCVRCEELRVPCHYGHVGRIGKPRGSHNRKTLEKAQRLREANALLSPEGSHITSTGCSSPVNPEYSSTWATVNLTDMTDMPGLGPYWTPTSESPGYVGEISAVGELQPGETMDSLVFSIGDGSNTTGTTIERGLAPRHHRIGSGAGPSSAPCGGGSSAGGCGGGCVHVGLDTMAQPKREEISEDFDRAMQSTSAVWAAARALLACERCCTLPQPVFHLLWAIRRACRWLKRVDDSQMTTATAQIGHYTVPTRHLPGVYKLLVHLTLQDGVEVLQALRERLAAHVVLDAEGEALQLTANDVRYLHAALGECQEGLCGLREQ